MTETLGKIFQLLKVPKLLGYVLIIFLTALSFMGGLYITERFQDSFKTDRLIRERNYADRKDNEREIRKILSEIGSDIVLYLDSPYDSPLTPKPDFDELINKLNMVIENNTYTFSNELRSNLVQIRHILNTIKVRDEEIQGAFALVNDNRIEGGLTPIELIESMKKGYVGQFPMFEQRILEELDKIVY